MVSFRLLTFLFILSNVSKLVTGDGAVNRDQVPCEDETKTVRTTTTEGPTTTRRPCQKFSGTTAYRRQSGWWCSKMFYQDMQLNAPISYERGVGLCTMNKLPYVSSLETEKEQTDYAWLAPTINVYALWVNITFDTTKGVYEWGDEHSVRTIDPQPTVIDPNGKGVYTINRDPSVPGPGSLSIVQTNGVASTQAQVPCKDEPATKKPIIDHCRNHRGGAPYKRKSGWWCSQGYYLDVQSTTPMTLEEGINLCEMNGYKLSSLELDEERKDYAAVLPRYIVESYWVKISMNQTNGKYYWSDGYSTPTINPQPKVMDPNGAGVFTLSRDPSVPGHGRLSIVPTNGKTTGPITPFVRGVICGAPGLD